MSSHDSKSRISPGNPPINNLAQQLSKLRRENSSSALNRTSTSAIPASRQKQKTQTQG